MQSIMGLSELTEEGWCRTSRAAKNSPVGIVVVVVVVVVAVTPGGMIIIHCCKHWHIKTYASVSAYKTENLAVFCHIVLLYHSCVFCKHYSKRLGPLLSYLSKSRASV